ncbi:twin-arginine translocase TatA/TatE family subunit [Paenarthrobacter sp. Z7-10]|uniref:twin-arginine translocase TatA/TatE family subunit n=1 Tax=Paenarthrobacter sp. Z7-10 TaxID=2787635 RepID=UPI0022A9B8ED|nr:twin-arginine translocase TatA/TatE family subunit [Paenarthrobacter sp. Z7-10]MCZ2404011.1 twin-arginine translocase TatA/TatE family subunit [Paenarthrobacter sp. Z7-10]
MLGINTPELLIIAVVAVLVIGPQRLPEYVEKLKNLIREVRRMAAGARETIKDEAGVDLDEIDWKKLDPRQYDPRRIIRDALMDDEPAVPSKGISSGGPEASDSSLSSSEPAAAGLSLEKVERLAAGQRAPFDLEST